MSFDSLHFGATQQSDAMRPRQLAERHHASQRVTVALGRNEISTEQAVGQRRGEVAQFVAPKHMALDAPTPFHR